MEDMKKEVESMKERGFISSFLSFDKMITPGIIKIVFLIGLGVSVLASLAMIIMGFNSYYGGGAQVFFGILMLVLSPIIVRVQCELLIIMFKIHESLEDIKRK